MNSPAEPHRRVCTREAAGRKVQPRGWPDVPRQDPFFVTTRQRSADWGNLDPCKRSLLLKSDGFRFVSSTGSIKKRQKPDVCSPLSGASGVTRRNRNAGGGEKGGVGVPHSSVLQTPQVPSVQGTQLLPNRLTEAPAQGPSVTVTASSAGAPHPQ